MKDRVHLVVSVSPKISISELMGVLKGKTAIGFFRNNRNLRRKPYWGNHFWSRGYCVTTIGLDEEKERLEKKEREEPGHFSMAETQSHHLWRWIITHLPIRSSLTAVSEQEQHDRAEGCAGKYLVASH